MSDLIKRQDAIDACLNGCCACVGDCVDEIKKLPSAQKTGKWINANDGKWNTCEILKCSACGEMDNRMYRTDNYCPNCGARME